MDRYDLCVLGAGPAGIAGAIRAADLGKRVALVDGGPLGGVGIFDGALSSKTLWHLSGDFARAQRRDRGYDGSALVASWRAIRAEVASACIEAQALLETQILALANRVDNRGSIERIQGRGHFVARDVITIATSSSSAALSSVSSLSSSSAASSSASSLSSSSAASSSASSASSLSSSLSSSSSSSSASSSSSERTITADRFLLAVGSKPRVPPNIPVDGVRVLTSDHVEHVSELPARLAIIGAGVVGCEYATIFAHFRSTRVELFDRQPRILPFEDEDVSAVVASRFAEIGVHVHRKAQIQTVTVVGDEVEVAWLDDQGAPRTQRYDRVLVATGRAPSTTGLGLEHTGVSVDPRTGGVVVDSCRAVGAPHIWAAGDVTPDLMLANLAELEARHCVEDMYGLDPPPLVHEAQSAIYFLSPEVAAVGLDEQMARAKGIRYRAAIVMNTLNRRNLAMRATAGFVKLLARPDGRLLGLRVVGPQAGTCIQGVALLIGQGGTLDAVDRCVHPHPAVTEGVLEAARLLLGTSLYKPDAMDGRCRIVTG